MRVVLMSAVAVVAVMALTACDKPEEPASAPKAGAAASIEAPKRKPGLWAQMATMEGGQSVSSRICLDQSTDTSLPIQGQKLPGSTCSSQTMAREGDGSYSFASTCSAAEATIKSEGKISGDFNTAYSVTTTTAVTGAAKSELNRTSQITIASRWTGPCPAGWIPGDIELPGGTRVNTVATLESMNAAAGQ